MSSRERAVSTTSCDVSIREPAFARFPPNIALGYLFRTGIVTDYENKKALRTTRGGVTAHIDPSIN